MPNPIYQAMGGNMQLPGPFGNMNQMKQAYAQFRNNFQGDPKQKIQEMLQSGQISQAQLNQAQQMAQQLQQFLG